MGDAGKDSGILLSDKDKLVHPFDFDPSVNNGYEGGKFARPIKRWLNAHRILLPSEPQLLGLGAGIANPECSLADNLGIPYQNVTLVDKNPDIARHPILVEHRQGVDIWQVGAFLTIWNIQIENLVLLLQLDLSIY